MKNAYSKLISLIAAGILSISSVCTFSSSALLQEDYANGTLSQVIESFGEGTLVDYWDANWYNISALIFTSDYKGYFFTEYYRGTTITVKDGEALPVEEINEKIEPYSINVNDDGEYKLSVSLIADRDGIYDIIKEYESVLSIDEKYVVCKSRNDLWGCNGVNFNTDLSNEEIISMFPELALTDGNSPPGFEGTYLEFSTGISYETLNEEVYNGLKKLMESGLDYKLVTIVAEGLQDDYHSGTVNVYTAEEEAVQTTTNSEITTTTTTTTTTAAASSTTAKKGVDSPKTGDAGIAGVLLAGAGAVAMAFALRKRED